MFYVISGVVGELPEKELAAAASATMTTRILTIIKEVDAIAWKFQHQREIYQKKRF